MRQNKKPLINISLPLLMVIGMLSMSAVKANETQEAIEGFGVNVLGDRTVGTNGIGVRMNGNVRIGLSDTINRDEFAGVGSFVNRLHPEDLKTARDIHRQLCENEGKKISPEKKRFWAAANTYTAKCIREKAETLYRGSVDELPPVLRDAVYSFYERLFNTYLDGARADVKLDVAVDSISRQNDKFLVSVKLVNSGDYSVDTHAPDFLTLPHGLWIEGRGATENDKWLVMLSGSTPVNKSDYPGEWVTLPARSTITYKFLTVPHDKIKAGTYRFNASIVMGISAQEFPANSMGLVDFHSDYKNPTKVTFDRDYPSTAQEWKDYESRKAKEVSPVAPGAAITEPGFYRAVSQLHGHEPEPFLREFKVDVTAPKPDGLTLPHWVWVADTARANRCEPGQPCPRDGRWMLRSYGR